MNWSLPPGDWAVGVGWNGLGNIGGVAMRPMIAFSVAFCCALTAGRADAAGEKFNGEWSVTQSAQGQGCPNGFRFTVRIDNGRVAYVGRQVLEADGGISPAGRVDVKFAYGSYTLQGTGGLNEHFGTGRWSVPNFNCSGDWRAEKR
jgi:hypothetical protein